MQQYKFADGIEVQAINVQNALDKHNDIIARSDENTQLKAHPEIISVVPVEA